VDTVKAMDEQITLAAQRRTLLGKKVGRLRRRGIIPANIYGRGMESIPVQIDVRDLRDALLRAGTTTVVTLQVRGADGGAGGAENGATYPVLIERIQRHPASGQVLHVDLLKVDLNRPVRAVVPIRLVGEAPAVAAGGVLYHPLDEIEVEALPRDLPHEIVVDVSTLVDVDAQITVGDLRLPPGVTVDAAPETVVVKVTPSKVELEIAAEEAEAAAAAEAAAPAAPAAPEAQAPAGEQPGSAGGSARTD
jgi:large subunit ribosomal protein L25